MSNARLMKPLFYDGNFNRDGKKMRAVFEREISDGTVSYRLWRSDGKPDIQYPRAENDNYLLYAEIRDYLVPLRITDFYLIDHAGYPAAVAELYGNKDARNDYFDNLRKSGDDAVLEAVRRERERIMLLGSDPACQASYIKKLFDNNVACFGASKENGGESFPDYVGALILGELDKCVALSAVYRKKDEEVAKERRAKGAQCSQRFFDCMSELIHNVCAETEG